MLVWEWVFCVISSLVMELFGELFEYQIPDLITFPWGLWYLEQKQEFLQLTYCPLGLSFHWLILSVASSLLYFPVFGFVDLNYSHCLINVWEPIFF